MKCCSVTIGSIPAFIIEEIICAYASMAPSSKGGSFLSVVVVSGCTRAHSMPMRKALSPIPLAISSCCG